MPQITLLNCFLLLLPIFLWNLILTPKLTQPGFKADDRVARWVLWLETGLRVVVFGYPLFLPLRLVSPVSQLGLVIYLVGVLVYFGAWIPLVYFPAARWSSSPAGVLAPHVTPLIWLVGIGLIGQSWVYVGLSVGFVAVHTLHGLQSFEIWEF